MMIKGVRKSDLGSYRCVSRNPAGETSTTLHLIRPKLSPGSVEAANGLEVRLDPELKVANLGSSAKFTCRIVDKTKSMTGGEAGSYSGKMNDDHVNRLECVSFKRFLFGAVSKFNLSWLKDGRPVLKMPRVRVTEFSSTTSSSVTDGKAVMAEADLFVNNVQKEDSGAYQCVVGMAGDSGNGVSETQASAELRLGGKILSQLFRLFCRRCDAVHSFSNLAARRKCQLFRSVTSFNPQTRLPCSITPSSTRPCSQVHSSRSSVRPAEIQPPTSSGCSTDSSCQTRRGEEG